MICTNFKSQSSNAVTTHTFTFCTPRIRFRVNMLLFGYCLNLSLDIKLNVEVSRAIVQTTMWVNAQTYCTYYLNLIVIQVMLYMFLVTYFYFLAFSLFPSDYFSGLLTWPSFQWWNNIGNYGQKHRRAA